MNKKRFLQWLKDKNNYIREHIPGKFMKDKEAKAFLQGCIFTIEEIERQVEEGKFDMRGKR